MGNVLILNYHRIIDDERECVDDSILTDKQTVKKADLINQLNSIQAAGIPIIALDLWNKGDFQDQFAVALTFSGDHKSDSEIVLPLLKSLGLTATFFPTLSIIDTKEGVTWKDLKSIIDNGMEIGSQGVSGQNLRRISKNACQLELELSKRIIENNLGKKVVFFAPSSGNYNRRLLQLAYNAGYQKVLTNRAKINTNTHTLLQHRFTVKANTNISTLEKLIVKGLLSHSKRPLYAKLSSLLSVEFGIGIFNKEYINGYSRW